MKRLGVWSVAAIVGIVGAYAAWTALHVVGYDGQVTTGLGAGAGVGIAALTGRWIDKRRQARELLAEFEKNNRPER